MEDREHEPEIVLFATKKFSFTEPNPFYLRLYKGDKGWASIN